MPGSLCIDHAHSCCPPAHGHSCIATGQLSMPQPSVAAAAALRSPALAPGILRIPDATLARKRASHPVPRALAPPGAAVSAASSPPFVVRPAPSPPTLSTRSGKRASSSTAPRGRAQRMPQARARRLPTRSPNTPVALGPPHKAGRCRAPGHPIYTLQQPNTQSNYAFNHTTRRTHPFLLASVAYGTVAAEYDFPYYAGLAKRDGTWAGCGGTLVAPRMVITAGASQAHAAS